MSKEIKVKFEIPNFEVIEDTIIAENDSDLCDKCDDYIRDYVTDNIDFVLDYFVETTNVKYFDGNDYNYYSPFEDEEE